jgi:hypothetical protein
VCIGIDRDRPDPGYLRPFVKKIASDDPTIKLSYSRIEIWMRNEKSHQPRCNFSGWKVWRKIVPLCDAFEGFKADAPALRRVSWYTATQFQIHAYLVLLFVRIAIPAAQPIPRLTHSPAS